MWMRIVARRHSVACRSITCVGTRPGELETHTHQPIGISNSLDMIGFRRAKGLWIPASEPVLGTLPAVKLVSKKQVSANRMRFEMELKGPDHMGLYVQPLNTARVADWSFHQAPLRLNFEPPYYIYYSYGVNGHALQFWLELEVSLRIWKCITKQSTDSSSIPSENRRRLVKASAGTGHQRFLDTPS